MKIAVIVTTYNRPGALAAVLDGYLAQRDRNFGIVVADDGSGPETAAVVSGYRRRAEIAIDHVWQEDEGFRAAGIRNRALALTRADYLIFTDGDCIPLPGFVAGHRRLAERGWFVAGNRVLLNENLTRRILEGRLPPHPGSPPEPRPIDHSGLDPESGGGAKKSNHASDIAGVTNEGSLQRSQNDKGGAAAALHMALPRSTGEWLRAFLRGEINRVLPLMPLALPNGLRKLPARRWQGVMTCNLSAWREDLLAINGFDEEYEGWGLEDSDLAIRLLHSGLRRKSARFAAPLLHLWHPENDRGSLAANRRRLEALRLSRQTRAVKGVDRHC